MKVLVATVYMGPLPANLPLWYRSCAANPEIDWLLITDQIVDAALVPKNVRIKYNTLKNLRCFFSKQLGFSVALNNAYKLNDFKPLFFELVDNLDEYDYWGFCDLDVQFGSLRPFFDKVAGHAMILSEGHLRFIKNTHECNNTFRSIVTPRNWRDILRDPVNFGMDEHHGVNRAFYEAGLPVFADSSLIADIDPNFRQFRCLPQYRNYRTQAFAYENGRIIREYWHRGRYGRDEFLYIHFQKRKLTIDVGEGDESFFITPKGFLPRKVGQSDAKTIMSVNPWVFPNRREFVHLMRVRARLILNGDPYVPVRLRSGRAL